MRRRFLLAVLPLTLGLACSAAAPAPAPAVAAPQQRAAPAPQAVAASGEPQVFEILQQGNRFQPDRITVRAGAAVRFVIKNDDAEEHNLVSAEIQFPQNQQSPGGSYTVDWVTLTRPGTYEALCAFHAPNMKISIVVQ